MREELEHYAPLARRIAREFSRRLPEHVMREDLYAAAMVGLFDALRLQSFRGEEFERYARTRIQGEILDELRRQDWLTKRARMRAGARKVVVLVEDLPVEGQHHALGVAMPAQGDSMARRTLDRAVRELSPRLQAIVFAHYVGHAAFNEIAAAMELSCPRVFQLHRAALDQLRDLLHGRRRRKPRTL